MSKQLVRIKYKVNRAISKHTQKQKTTTVQTLAKFYTFVVINPPPANVEEHSDSLEEGKLFFSDF